MQIRAEEISSIIKNQINDYESKVEVAETGTVLSVGDGIARIYGLRSAMAGEMIEFDEGTRAIVLNLEEGMHTTVRARVFYSMHDCAAACMYKHASL